MPYEIPEDALSETFLAACGPGVLPQHTLHAEPRTFRLRLSPVD